MEKQVKEVNRWKIPQLAIERHSHLNIIKSGIEEIKVYSPCPHEELISTLLGPVVNTTPANDYNVLPETNSAYANLITDISTDDAEVLLEKKIRSVLKGLQPYRERPSKDRSTRFAAGQLAFNQTPSHENNVANYSYWCIKPLNSNLSAGVFLLGQIVYICQEDKPVETSITNCSNAFVMLNITNMT